MTEITVSNNNYRIGKLDAFQQFHVGRRIAPMVPAVMPVFIRIAKSGGSLMAGDAAGMVEIMEPFAKAFAEMPEDDANYVLATCLGVVARQQGDAWSPVWNIQRNTMMFDDLDIAQMLPLVVRVLRDNLGGFISGLLTSASIGQEQA